MMQTKAVLWDMDGTLVDSEFIAVEALRRVMLDVHIDVPSDIHHMVAGRSSDDIYRWAVDNYGLTLDPQSWEKRKHQQYFLAAHQLAGFADAIGTWRRLERAGIAQAVVSNSDRAIMDVNLRSAGLIGPGMITVSRNDVRNGKPDPEGYLRAAWLLNIEPGSCVIIEDSPSGAAAGLAAGMTTFFVPHSTVTAPQGVRQLVSMAELEDMVLGSAAA